MSSCSEWWGIFGPLSVPLGWSWAMALEEFLSLIYASIYPLFCELELFFPLCWELIGPIGSFELPFSYPSGSLAFPDAFRFIPIELFALRWPGPFGVIPFVFSLCCWVELLLSCSSYVCLWNSISSKELLLCWSFSPSISPDDCYLFPS